MKLQISKMQNTVKSAENRIEHLEPQSNFFALKTENRMLSKLKGQQK